MFKFEFLNLDYTIKAIIFSYLGTDRIFFSLTRDRAEQSEVAQQLREQKLSSIVGSS